MGTTAGWMGALICAVVTSAAVGCSDAAETSQGGDAGTSGGGGGTAQGGAAGTGGSGGSDEGTAGAGAGTGGMEAAGSGGTGGVAAAAGSGGTGGSWPDLDVDAVDVTALMLLAADWGYASLDCYDHDMTTGTDWSTGAFYTGMTGTWRVTGDATVRQRILDWAQSNDWQPDMGLPTHPDNMACMQTYCEAFILEPDPANDSRYLPTRAIIDERLAQPNLDGGDWFYWEDGLYMGPPVIAMVGAITGDDSYFDALTDIWFDAAADLYDPEHHLWFWRNDFKTPDHTTPAGHPEFWGPGNAWVLGGLIRVLEYMPVDHPDRPQWITMLQEMAEALRVQQGDDGFWRTSLYEPTEFPDPESSCTSFFTYAMALGVQHGHLDGDVYVPVIERAWNGLVTAVDADGKVGRCQPWSLAPGGAPEGHTTPEGQGAFLLAAEGVYRLLQ